MIAGVLVIASVTSIGQGPPNPYTNGDGTGIYGNGLHNGPTGAPIDGGLGIILILASGFGIKKAYQFKKKKD